MLFSKRANNENNRGEKKAFERYRKALNKMCKDCQYKNCQFRNKREILKAQKDVLHELCCQKEHDNNLNAVLKSKLP